MVPLISWARFRKVMAASMIWSANSVFSLSLIRVNGGDKGLLKKAAQEQVHAAHFISAASTPAGSRE